MVLPNIDCDTVLSHNSGGSDIVMTDSDFIASPLAVFLKLTDHAGQHFLLHPACGDLCFPCNIIMPARGLILLLSLSCLSNLVCGISVYAMHSC